FSSRRRHTRSKRDWSSDVCSSDLETPVEGISLSMPNISEYLHVFGQISWNQTGNIVFWLTSISFAMVIVFENIGLIHGHCKMLNRLESSKKSLQATSMSVLSSGILGTSPTVASVEVAAGITTGGRTGLTSVVTEIGRAHV